MNDRLKWLRNKLNAMNMQGMIVQNPINIKYLTGIDAEGILLITRKENVYITDGRYIEAVQSTLTIYDDIVLYDMKNLSNQDYENFFVFCENVGFEENYITYAGFKECMHKYKINNFIETENIIEKQRQIKDDEEIENIKHACQITDECFFHLIKFIKKGMTEKEVACEIERFFFFFFCELAFDSIVASGKNSSKPHAVPTEKKIESGDIITIDFGCKYNGYCSDMTRSLFVDYVREDIKKIYDLVLKNQQQVLKDYKDGANTKSITKIVDNSFRIYDYMLIHGLGHGVGMEIHELPQINLKKEFTLKENMVVTDEPGIYIPGQFGVRIEDTVVITKNGCISLTKSDKNYIVI